MRSNLYIVLLLLISFQPAISNGGSILTITVDKSGSGDYKTIAEAVQSAAPGQTIQVKNGTYNRKIDFKTSGTKEYPIKLTAYPGHRPILDFTDSPDKEPRVEINAEHIIVEGLEIRNGWDGVKVYRDNVTIRKNYIHQNRRQGVLVVNANDVLIEYNRIERNGVAPGTCIFDGKSTPRHCHGIYFSNWKCEGATSRNYVRHNTIRGHGGSAVQFNGFDNGACKSISTGNIIANNTFEDNAVGMFLYHSLSDNIIRNNRFKVDSVPRTDEKYPSFLSIWGSKGNKIEHNSFTSGVKDYVALKVNDNKSKNNQFKGDKWRVKDKRWMWGGKWRKDWTNRDPR